MLITDVDALREWLAGYLAPLCDADPPALAKYCIALIRKDKPQSELKDDMLQQLDVFLQENTATFVDKFLTIVQSNSYLPKGASVKATPTCVNNNNTNNNNNVISSKSIIKPTSISETTSKIIMPSSPPPPPKLSTNLDAATINGSDKVSNTFMISPVNKVSVATKTSIKTVVTTKPSSNLTTFTITTTNNGVLLGAQPPGLPAPIVPLHVTSATAVFPGGGVGAGAAKKEDARSRKEEGRSWRSRSRDRRRSRSRGRAGGRSGRYDDRNRRRTRRSWSRSSSPSLSRRSRSPRPSRYSRTSPSSRNHRNNRSPNRRSRSPTALLRSHSPNKHRSRSPLTSQRLPHSPGRHSPIQTHSPVRRSSPSPVRKSHSPLLRSRSRSPLGIRRSRSPLGIHRSRSPLMHAPLHGKGEKAPQTAGDSPDRGQSPLLTDLPDDKNDSSSEVESSHPKLSAGRRKKHRCKDYDEKGYCMRGDQCPYDHGADPVVLDFPSTYTSSSSAVPLQPTHGLDAGPASGGRGLPGGPNMAVPPPLHLAARLTLPHHPLPQDVPNEYTPSDPSLWGTSSAPNTSLPPPSQYYNTPGGGVRHSLMLVGDGGRAGPPPPILQGNLPPLHQPPPSVPLHLPPPALPVQHFGVQVTRELISVATDSANQHKAAHLRTSLAQRLGPPSMRGVARDNCSLELRKVPRGLNTITHLNSHFTRFGSIVNMQVQHEGDPEAAIVTFSKHSEANAAYRSTEAVLNNRFIKVFWHTGTQNSAVHGPPVKVERGSALRNPNKFLDNTAMASLPPAATAADEAGELTGPPLGSNTDPSSPSAVAAPDSSTAAQPKTAPPRPTAAEIKQQQIDAILRQQKKLAEEIALKQKEQKRMAEAVKLKSEVQERTKQLLDKQMGQLKLLLAKFESCKATTSKTEQKELLLTIKSLQSSIESTKERIKVALPCARAVSRPTARPTQPVARPTQLTQASIATAVTATVAKGTTELTKKILDTELDVYAATVAAADTPAKVAADGVTPAPSTPSSAQQLAQLSLKLAQLRAHARQLGSVRNRGAASYRGASVRGRGRGTSLAVAGAGLPYVVPDRRSTQIHASGFEREDKNDVLTHFAGLGNVINFLWDGQTPSVVVEYSTRRHAEKAMSDGRMLKDRLLTLTWVNESKAAALPPVPSTQSYQELQYDGSRSPEADDDDDEKHSLDASPPAAVSATTTVEAKEAEDGKNVEAVEKVEVKEEEDVMLLPNEPSPALHFGADDDDQDVVVEAAEDDDDEEEQDEGVRSWKR